MNKRKSRSSDHHIDELTNNTATMAHLLEKRAMAFREIEKTLRDGKAKFPVQQSALAVLAEEEMRMDVIADTMDNMPFDSTLSDISGLRYTISLGEGEFVMPCWGEHWESVFAIIRCIPRSKRFDTLLLRLYKHCRKGVKEDGDLSAAFCKCIDEVVEEIKKSDVSVHIRKVAKELD